MPPICIQLMTYNIVSENIAAREQAAEQAQTIITARPMSLIMWLRSLDSVDLIRHYRNDVQDIKSELVEPSVSCKQAKRQKKLYSSWQIN